jgi:CHASE3 domain sensor protein
MHGRLNWIGFLAMAFAVVGMAGLFASYALPIALDRAIAQTALLDGAGSPESRIVAALGEAAAQPILHSAADDAAKLHAAAQAILRQAAAEQDATALRLRWLIVVVSLMGAAFGAAVLGAGQRPPPLESD